MCWMVVKQAGKKVNEEYMDEAQKHNKDGYGVAWYENGFVNTYKTFNYTRFKAMCNVLEGFSLVIHLRHATKGKKSYNNIHPFEIPSGVMFHNGTMFKSVPKGDESDSQALANTISECDYKFIEDITPLIKPYIDDKINRLVFFEDNGSISILNKHLGIEEDGSWYSNDYHLKKDGWCRTGCITTKKEEQKVIKPEPRFDKVFVYGTLKRGGSNSTLLKDAVYLGKAVTRTQWTMIGKEMPFPYVLEEDEKLGGYISGEVYAVSKSELRQLDRLEGVPHHYKKQEIKVVYNDDSSIEEVTMYVKSFISESTYESRELITEWSA